MQTNIRVSFIRVPSGRSYCNLSLPPSPECYALFVHFPVPKMFDALRSPFVRAHHKIEICLYRKFVIVVRFKPRKKGRTNQQSKEQQQLAYSIFIYPIASNSCTADDEPNDSGRKRE